MSYYRNPKINSDKSLQAYVIGLAIGDGNLTNPNQRAARLRITYDKKYPFLLKKVHNSLGLLFPENKIGLVDRGNCVDVSVHSKHLEKLLGWKAKNGSKFIQNVSVHRWIMANRKYRINCLRGLIETDGSIYSDRGYKMVMFVTIIPTLARQVNKIITSLDFMPHLYQIERHANKYNYNQQTLFHVRLSKNVDKFLDLIRPDKI